MTIDTNGQMVMKSKQQLKEDLVSQQSLLLCLSE